MNIVLLIAVFVVTFIIQMLADGFSGYHPAADIPGIVSGIHDAIAFLCGGILAGTGVTLLAIDAKARGDAAHRRDSPHR
jgi:hypothetical protein